MCALPANRHATSVPDALIGTDLDFSTNVVSDLTTQVTLDSVICFDVLTNCCELGLA